MYYCYLFKRSIGSARGSRSGKLGAWLYRSLLATSTTIRQKNGIYLAGPDCSFVRPLAFSRELSALLLSN